MTLTELLAELSQSGVKLSAQGDQLRIHAPRDSLTPTLKKAVIERKEALLSVLGRRNGATPIARVSRDQKLPLSFSQQRLWLIDQMVDTGHALNMPIALNFDGSLDRVVLERCLTEIVCRHEVLRTAFPEVDGEAVQSIQPSFEVELHVHDLSDLPQPKREEEARRMMIENYSLPFDLARGRLVRAILIKMSENEYTLLATFHHIVLDGWSVDVFARELGALYKSYSEKRSANLPNLPIQCADYSVWQRQWLQDEACRQQLDYWKQHLAGVQELQCPTDRPRPAVQSFKGACKRLVLPQTLSRSLHALSKQQGTTLFVTLLSAFKCLLMRYSGQDDIVVGTPVANRNRTEIENLIGFFTNMLVLRTDASENPSFIELLNRVRKVVNEAISHQDLPFEILVDELQLNRDLSRNPLFQVAFALQSSPASTLELPQLNISPPAFAPVEVCGGSEGAVASRFDLEFHLCNVNESIQGTLVYNTDLYDSGTIDRMLSHFEELLQSVVRNPHQQIWELPLLTKAERQQVVVEWNDTKTDFPKDSCIHELFEQQAQQKPEQVAVVYGDQQLTYGQLNRRSNRLAHQLKSLGVGPEVLVGVLMGRSLDLIVAFLAVMKAGGAYIPLDPAYIKHRLEFMLDDSGPPVLLTQQDLLGELPEYSGNVLCLDRDSSRIDRQPIDNISSGCSSENLAYVIYTSGSTGVPKGVEITHRGLLNLVYWHRRTYNITPADRAAQLAGIGFDACVWELWPYLSSGASIHLPDEETRNSPRRLWAWLTDRKISITFLSTPLAELVLQEPLPQGLTLRAMLTGGDRLTRGLDKPLPFELINHYGPTECTVVSTSATVGVAAPKDPAPPIGRPIDNVQAYLLDTRLQPVPIGVPGELYLGGDSLARGYLNRPELTAKKFINNPFKPGARLYKTGDVARYSSDGNIHFLGRNDDQVKIRGFRIELGEIESTLTKHPSVQDAVVVAHKQGAEKCLVGYVVLMDELPGSEIRDYLRDRLPGYMVPALFVMLDEMPLNQNGKVDKSRLPEPQFASSTEQVYVAPQSDLEHKIASVVRKVLHSQRIGLHDNFFDLGANSLLLIRIHGKLHDVLGQDLSVVDLFQYPTISALSNRLSRPHRKPPLPDGFRDRAEKLKQAMSRRRQLVTK